MNGPCRFLPTNAPASFGRLIEEEGHVTDLLTKEAVAYAGDGFLRVQVEPPLGLVDGQVDRGVRDVQDERPLPLLADERSGLLRPADRGRRARHGPAHEGGRGVRRGRVPSRTGRATPWARRWAGGPRCKGR